MFRLGWVGQVRAQEGSIPIIWLGKVMAVTVCGLKPAKNSLNGTKKPFCEEEKKKLPQSFLSAGSIEYVGAGWFQKQYPSNNITKMHRKQQ